MDEIKRATLELFELDRRKIERLVKGEITGYGLSDRAVEAVLFALEGLASYVNSSPVVLRRIAVVQEIAYLHACATRGIRKPGRQGDAGYKRFIDGALGQAAKTTWRGSAKLRAEVDELYRGGSR